MSDTTDNNAPKITKEVGAHHPINQMKDHIMDLLKSFGFQIISGPEVETEEFNFDMLNIKKSHPARQMHDTFYVNGKSNVLANCLASDKLNSSSAYAGSISKL